jgi:hypothetical protein
MRNSDRDRERKIGRRRQRGETGRKVSCQQI